MTIGDAKLLITHKALWEDKPQVWADLGCGEGLFTRALLAQLPEKSLMYGVDKKQSVFSDKAIHFIKRDFEKDDLPLSALDGIIMANSLHFIKNKFSFLQKLTTCLKPNGCFILVEYDMDIPNRWVPFPLSYLSATHLFAQSGFTAVRKINKRQSIYHRAEIYGAFTYLNIVE